ncbi:MAG: ATP-binding protein [Gammaproteobacteria bacterium]|uniref:ATP-binding protein n=1 Tax=Rhodoferax sp. TaxID=50421 RepID=UPI0017FD3589|nr:ATP-binding protein [Rhodoferax sp.]MBU3897328.1 ATP-binding protein [Gammaproteobacteria bacterium]MBA3057229.1 ATP-binding protein [Rhodoferax sp.]MBU3998296.1 ATP-binding protein [Gammaproteobacteria bacterium]MBU4018674.1 ATP-binding protein [Gammaproteobacteria bacterium]MBU4079629.1 ATP-binding protein [Gammaproteobacteria bacterium]
MDPYRNPFAPGAGSRPPELAGRDAILESARISCGRAINGRSARSIMLLGLRGTGKTVLLNEIGKIAQDVGFLVSKVEAPENEILARLLYPEMRKVMRSLSGVEAAKQIASRGLKGLRGFASIFKIEIAGVEISVEPEPGLADSGTLQYDLPDLFEVIGRAAKAAGKGWILLIDEVQYLSGGDLSALIVAIHRMSQEGLPVLLVGAGLPQVARLAGEAKSYAERLFLYPGVGALDPQSAAQAVQKPIVDEDALITPAALSSIVDRTKGYPFFLQEWASISWNNAEGPEITIEEVNLSYTETLISLDAGFFRVRIDRLTKAEVQFVKTMSELGDGPYAMADIANAMDRSQSSLGPTRANIISKGMIYSTDHGYLDFTVPLFAEFMRRQ